MTSPRKSTRTEVIAEFEKIRQKQRLLYSKLMGAELELKEFCEASVILQSCNPKRKCWRLMSDLLVESNVENILPMFFTEKNRLETRIEELQIQIRQSSEALKEFQKTHKIYLKNCERKITDDSI